VNIDENLLLSNVWIIVNKTDLTVDKLWISSESRFAGSFSISAATGAGMDDLAAALATFAGDFFADTESSVVTRARHRLALEECISTLKRAVAQGASGREELIAEELRSAATVLGRLTGRVDVEDILDVIFRDFCIGK
jgi:tRNA modification GTPase